MRERERRKNLLISNTCARIRPFSCTIYNRGVRINKLEFSARINSRTNAENRINDIGILFKRIRRNNVQFFVFYSRPCFLIFLYYKSDCRRENVFTNVVPNFIVIVFLVDEKTAEFCWHGIASIDIC